MASNPRLSRAALFAIWGLGLIALVLAGYGIHSLTRDRVTITTTQVAYGDLVKSSSTNGKVEPIDDFQAHAQVAGQVQEIYVSVGDRVRPGQRLLKMDDADAQARVASNESTLRAAELALNDIEHGGTQDDRNTSAADLSKAKLKRQQDTAALASLQKLQQQGAASAAEITAAQAQVQLDDDTERSLEQHSTHRYDQADLARAQAQLADARAGVAAAQRSYGNTDIHTPIAGSVYYLPVSQYDYVDAGLDLVYVADLTRLQITAYFDEPEIGNLADGQPVEIIWEAKPGKVWHGHITQAPTTIITYGTRNVGECIITVDDAHGDLQPNANVTVTVTTARHPHVLSVPHEAIYSDPDGAFVLRVLNGRLVRTPVQIGIVNLTKAEITGGLAEGDAVALGTDLYPGLRVRTGP